jgi:hypothetical protein
MAWPEGEGVGALRYVERVVISSAPGNHNMLINGIFGRKEGRGGERGGERTFED